MFLSLSLSLSLSFCHFFTSSLFLLIVPEFLSQVKTEHSHIVYLAMLGITTNTVMGLLDSDYAYINFVL